MGTLKEVTDSSFQTDVLQSKVLTLVDFWAPWCAPCLMIAPELEKLAQEYGDEIRIVKVNVDENQEIAQQNNITSIPTLLFYKSGEMKDRLVGAHSKSSLKEHINKNL